MLKLMFNTLALKLSIYFQLTSTYQIYNKLNFIVNMLFYLLCLPCVKNVGIFNSFASLPRFTICRQHCNVLPNKNNTDNFIISVTSSSSCVRYKGTKVSLKVCQV